MGKGFLEVHVYLGDHVLPVKDARVLIKDTKGNVQLELRTNDNGITEKIPLDAPDKEWSQHPYAREHAPLFATFDVEVPRYKGYNRVMIEGVQIFDGETSILPVQVHPEVVGEPPEQNTDRFVIPWEHGVDEPRTMPLHEDTDAYRAMQVPLANEVKIPDYITVHLGSPNAIARNVKVSFVDYIKNVASSEIFPTWHESALYANIYCQISFVLNRVYTVWYRSRGFDFDITNNTAFDQYFVEGRNIFENISRIVDNIFNMFIRRQGRREPFFASYCNGTTSKCDGLSQWGSQELALQGYSPINILRYYFPSDVQIVESTNFTTNVGTFPGVSLKEGSSGEDVRIMQKYLNRISGNFYIAPISPVDGVFGTMTKNTTTQFQQLTNLIPDGIIGKGTWYEITRYYVAVKELAELTSEGERVSVGAAPPTVTIEMNARGQYVVELQFLLNFIGQFFPAVPKVVENGVFRDDTKRGVVEFQKEFGLTPDGVVGPSTWRKLYDVYHSITGNVVVPPGEPAIPAFPGVALRVGSRGNDVLIMQNYLNAIAKTHPSIPTLVPDGVFGSATEASVRAFQRLFGLSQDGVIGQVTWYKIVDVYNNLSAPSTPVFPGTALRVGSSGSDVRLMQEYLSEIRKIFPSIPSLVTDGIFGTGTEASVIAFQRLFGLTPDGVIGQYTWDKIVYVYNNLPVISVPLYPGTPLTVGSRGDSVILMQKYLNSIAARYPSIPTLVADGIFGSATQTSVLAFQRLFGLTADGVIGPTTWNWIVSVYNLIISGLPVSSAYTDTNANDDTYTGASVDHAYLPNPRSRETEALALLLALSMRRRPRWGYYY